MDNMTSTTSDSNNNLNEENNHKDVYSKISGSFYEDNNNKDNKEKVKENQSSKNINKITFSSDISSTNDFLFNSKIDIDNSMNHQLSYPLLFT